MDNLYLKDTSQTLINGRHKTANNISLPAHYHKQTEFVYVLNGSINLCVNGQEMVVKQNEYVIIKSLDVHSFQTIGEHSKVLLIILPDVLTIKLSVTNLTTKRFSQSFNQDIQIIVKMYEDFKLLNHTYMSSYYNMIFDAIVDLYSLNDGKIDTLQNTIIEFINNHFSENLTLMSVAKSCNTNRSYVSRAINNCYGVGFKQYINRLRVSYFLDKFLEEENQKDNTIEEMALSVGFSDVRSFYRAFDKELNCTPTKYLEDNFKSVKENKQ